MAKKRCAKGHEYDDDIFGVCPECNGAASKTVLDFEGNKGGGIGKTEAIGYGSSAGYIEKTDGGGYNGGYAHRTDIENDRIIPDNNGNSTGTGIGKTQKIKTVEDTNGGKAGIGKTTFIKFREDGKSGSKNSVVVGWLVCIEGEEKGKSFILYPKINSIGRGEHNDVCIKGDYLITSGKEAKLAYDYKNNAFHIIPGEDSQNTGYLNDEPLYEKAKLNAYDVIELGKTKLVFVPFCGEQFKWEFDV